MLGIQDAAKQQLFMHYCPYPGFINLKRWVRDKNYKLYDSSAGLSYKFYNIRTDEKEKIPLNDSLLSAEEKAIKQRFKFILDSMPTWPRAPEINNAYATNVTENSATLTATIVNPGATALIDRGSTFARLGAPYLDGGRMHDPFVNSGTFSESRIFPRAETQYKYSLYAMNANESHSTSFAIGSLYTLSAPPVAQPSYFEACTNSSSVLLSWGNAAFPKKGASQAGYAIFYSTDSIQLIKNPNGLSQSRITKNGILIPFAAKPVNEVNDTSLRISGLQKNLKYYFLLVPYTYNGITDSTCNYLTAGALTATVNYTEPLVLNFTDKQPVCFDSKDGIIKASAFNGTSPYTFSINGIDYTQDSVFKNLPAGNYLINC